jgi:Magnesium chelatase, subunit ChlI
MVEVTCGHGSVTKWIKSSSDVGLIGGGHVPRPGDVLLAHHGVRFLDELPEFRRYLLEVLRQPLADGVVTIARMQMGLGQRVAATTPPCSASGMHSGYQAMSRNVKLCLSRSDGHHPAGRETDTAPRRDPRVGWIY